MTRDARTVSELGEAGLIALVTSYLPEAPPGELWTGDDAAVIAPAEGRALLTTDTMVEGVDFDLSYCDGYDIGWKAVAVNVSDVAAMGGRPTHGVATLALPPATEVTLVEGLARGMTDAAGEWGLALVGGDVSSAPVLVAGLTVLGVAPMPVTRAGARPGDAVCVTGAIGGSWGGLELLRRGLGDRAPALITRHLRPRARPDEGRELARHGATAMIDVSDGFAIDLVRLMKASGTGCRVDPEAVPLDPGLRVLPELDVARAEDLLMGAILGGEDFELLATARPEDLPPGLVTVVGEVTGDGMLRLGDDDLEEVGRRGWDHLRGR
ncbi:MAG TPA: thiamine-phosphate kinase [Actinomycetota bacterium]|nr:thiamine-phosphate kinase [Actinomycetota bacterium]